MIWTRNKWFVVADRDSLRHDFYHYFLCKVYDRKEPLSETEKAVCAIIKADDSPADSRLRGEWSMAVRIFLSSSLRTYVPGYDPLEGIQETVEQPIPLKEFCSRLKIPVQAIKIAMADGKRVSMDYVIRGNERLALFPPVGGG